MTKTKHVAWAAGAAVAALLAIGITSSRAAAPRSDDRLAQLERRVGDLEQRLRKLEKEKEEEKAATYQVRGKLQVPPGDVMGPGQVIPPGWVCGQVNGLPHCQGPMTMPPRPSRGPQ